MTELFQTTYKSRPPVVEGLLYAGAYILAGAPKIGKSFLVAQIAHHVSVSVGSSRPRFVGSNEPLFVGKPEANR